MKLDPEKVKAIFLDCLFKKGENTNGNIEAEGIMSTVGFHPKRLEEYRKEIEGILEELPEQFKKSGGGGWSFLNACNDKHGNQWTGFHQRMDQLFQLGIAIGKAKSQFPRDMWEALPGGMPYYVIN